MKMETTMNAKMKNQKDLTPLFQIFQIQIFQKILLIPLVGIAVAAAATYAHANESATDAITINDPIQELVAEKESWLNAEAYLVSDFSVSKNKSGNYRDNLKTANSYVMLTAQITSFIKARLTLELDKVFREHGHFSELDFDIESFVEEANIEIRFNDNQPIAIIVGKQPIAFGANFSQMPANYNGPFFEALRQRQVFGFTVELQDIFGLDVAEFSFFETKEGDLDIGTFDGGSFRLSKSLGENFYLSASAMYKGNKDTGDKHEHRANIGIVYMDATGLSVWAETLYAKNHPVFLDNEFGITSGASFPVGKGKIIAEVTWLIDAFTQLAIGYNIPITKNVSAGVEVRYTFAESNSPVAEGLSIGGNVQIYLGPEPLNDNPIFRGSEKEKTNLTN